MLLSKKILPQLRERQLSVPTDLQLTLPERVLQFGSGVLLRGLPDYYIDKANKQGLFNGRIVMVQSTQQTGTEPFREQEGLYTQCLKGHRDGQLVEEYIVNGAVSRVLSARTQWNDVLACAANPSMQVIISNTTETGIVLIPDDNIYGRPPVSFPGKLLAFLYRRFKHFKGDPRKGMVIVPAELITDNGSKLQAVVMELAHLNNFNYAFIDWLETANHFCNSLVDRIVPGRLPGTKHRQTEEKLGYRDDLLFMSETYGLWAIEARSAAAREALSFAGADPGVIVTDDISAYRELKLRLLNATHTFSCGTAFLAGIETVREAMEDPVLGSYIRQLLDGEIVTYFADGDIPVETARAFIATVTERFSNPYLDHSWLQISLHYTHKMRQRNVPLLLDHYRRRQDVPELMAMGFAAYLLFMKCSPGESGRYYGEVEGQVYLVQDDHTAWFHELWQSDSLNSIVATVTGDEKLWGANLKALPGFAAAVTVYLESFLQKGIKTTIRNFQQNRNKAANHEA
ncbi:MAG: tagaturonate reductase [Candidatus Pseudobacter hemicellulosilyticus]|uniref:Tagaturonate reductase n=1 Tax=Candidatus Pseudobacter hemicellulosilyticus TaxID=3121375 RepID=A0AAJ6BHZ1_9BACT|nr:MAG: tagaturonate reductase [Pseudobacter sp.]